MALGYVFLGKWRSLIRESDIAPGKVEVRKVLGRIVGIAKIDGHIYVFDGKCPHAGRSLRNCEVSSRGIIVCPGHGFLLSLSRRAHPDNTIPLSQLAFRVRGGFLEINRDALRRHKDR